MKVKELIDKLKELDQELEVLLHDSDYEGLTTLYRVEVWENVEMSLPNWEVQDCAVLE